MLILAQLTIKQMFRRGNVSSMDNYGTERPDLHAGGQNIIVTILTPIIKIMKALISKL